MDTHAPVLNHRLSGIDAAFLYLERKEIPLGIASVCVFDGPLPFDEFVANIDSKLHLLPRYRQIVVAPPFHIGYPVWEDDPHFDIRRHIFQAHLAPPGGEAELEALVGRVLSQMLDRGKPLWDIHVVDGLKGGRGALIARVHHALADGIAGAALMKIMLDPTPEGSHAIRKPRSRPVPASRPDHSLADDITNAVRSTLENLLTAEVGLLAFTQALLSERMQSGMQRLVTLLPEMAAAVERLPFNKPCSGERKFCWAEFDFADVKAIRAAAGGTVNDVILAVLTLAIARYVILHGESVHNRFVRVVCPVNLRQDQGETMGNRISFLPVVLPLDIKNPVRMLHAVSTRMEIMKSAGAAELVAILGSWLGAAPPPLQAFLWWGVPLIPLPVPLFNIICTNVPGPATPLYSVGRRMLASYPQVPTGYEMGVNVAVQSYDGKLFFGLIADAYVASDVGRLRDFIKDAFRDLCRAAGVRKARRRAAVKPKPPQPEADAPPAAAPAPDPVEEYVGAE